MIRVMRIRSDVRGVPRVNRFSYLQGESQFLPLKLRNRPSMDVAARTAPLETGGDVSGQSSDKIRAGSGGDEEVRR